MHSDNDSDNDSDNGSDNDSDASFLQQGVLRGRRMGQASEPTSRSRGLRSRSRGLGSSESSPIYQPAPAPSGPRHGASGAAADKHEYATFLQHENALETFDNLRHIRGAPARSGALEPAGGTRATRAGRRMHYPGHTPTPTPTPIHTPTHTPTHTRATRAGRRMQGL